MAPHILLLAASIAVLHCAFIGVDSAPTAAPTIRLTSAPSTATPYDPTVGTALAPTTPGGACINSADYSLWTGKISTGQTGFDLFPADLQSCNERCASLLQIAQSPEYQCGGFSLPKCPEDIYGICVRDCMARQPVLTQADGFPTLLTPGAYSLGCAACMGNVSMCAVNDCFSSCILGNENIACKQCNEANCNPVFQRCSGLNINQKLPVPFDFTGVIIGAVSVGGGLLLSAGFFGYRYRLKTRKHRAMSVQDLARMANSPQNLVGFRDSLASANPLNLRQETVSEGSRTPKTNPEAKPSPVLLTPYQMQYEAQQKANASNIPHQRPAPSARMSLLASQPSQSLKQGAGVPLVMLWTFHGERADELTLEIGTKLVGLEQADGWWLAQTKDGQLGLVPVNYTAHDAPTKKAYPTRTVPPSARITSMRTSILASPSQRILQMPASPLIAIYDFDAERDDEFSLKEGMVVLGIHEQDGWWLVRSESGDKIGLVPSNYLERILASFNQPQLSMESPTGSLQIVPGKKPNDSTAGKSSVTSLGASSKWLMSEPDF